MRHSLLLLALVTGCQCVTVPERQYACEAGDTSCLRDAGNVADSGTPDAGRADAGMTDSGVPDAGEPDSGVQDAGNSCDGGLCRFEDGGFCNDWQCVQALWVPTPTSSSTGIRVIDLPPEIDGGQWAWFGGVLLPDGRVLAIANGADRFLIFDPRTEVITPVGPVFPGTARKFAGGVLARNGRVYIFPFEDTSLLEFNPEDGGFQSIHTITSPDGGAPLYVGGVLDAYGMVWSVSENIDGLPMLRLNPETKELSFYEVKGQPWGAWWGMARLPDDRLLAFPKEYPRNPSRLSPNIVAISPGPDDAGFEIVDGFDLNDGGFPLQGGSLTREGTVCVTPAGLEQRLVCVGLAPLGLLEARSFMGPVTGYGFNGTFSDGRVWTSPDENNVVARIPSDGGATTTMVVGGRYGYFGVVATPQGMVTIPGEFGRDFLLIQPGTPVSPGIYDSRPMPVLLSPYFNKL